MGAHDTVFNHYYFSVSVVTFWKGFSLIFLKFQTEAEPVRKKIYETKIVNKDGSMNFLNLSEGIEKLRMGMYAFHFETGVGYKLVSDTFKEEEKCGLKEIIFLRVIDPWYVIRKNSTFKEPIKVGYVFLVHFESLLHIFP